MLVATAAVLPLVAYGLISVRTLRTGTRQSVVAGTVSIASRAAAQIEQYVAHSVQILQSAGNEVHGTFLARWQQERILRNYVLTFPEFREITLYDREGRVLASSRLAAVPLTPTPAPTETRPILSPIQIDDDLLPKATVTLPIHSPGEAAWWLVGELRLEEMWRVVDRIRIGKRGYALLVDESGRLIAHGDPDQKARVARGEDVLRHPLAGAALRRGVNGMAPPWLEYTDASGRKLLAVAAPLASRSWTLIVEQPTREAYGLALRLERLLLVAIGLALLVTISVGSYWGRSFIAPLAALIRGTEAVAEGRLDTRVRIAREDEFRRLGDAFNSMADRLAALQEETRKQERQAMFGRVAAGLVHDLSHPIQNVGNNCRLMLKMYGDAEYRDLFRRTVDRELATVKRVLEDLRNLARPIPLERFPIDVGRSVGEVVESMQPLAEAAGLTLDYAPPEAPVTIEGDVFALGRVYRNLILNAVQATAPGGRVEIAAEAANGRARISVADTGCGIPPDRLQAIFDDFVTTKRRGLGLGLPIARKIVDQLGGSIRVSSEVGRGTTFVIEFPAVPRDRVVSA